MITTNLLRSHLNLRLANQGGEYLKSSLWRLRKPFSRYLSLWKMHMDSTSRRSGLFPILTKIFARHLGSSDEQKLWPLTIYRTNRWPDLSLPRKASTSFKLEQAGMLRGNGFDIKITSEDLWWEVENDSASVAEVLVFDLVFCYTKYNLYCIRWFFVSSNSFILIIRGVHTAGYFELKWWSNR